MNTISYETSKDYKRLLDLLSRKLHETDKFLVDCERMKLEFIDIDDRRLTS